jgi:hypothetical protein
MDYTDVINTFYEDTEYVTRGSPDIYENILFITPAIPKLDLDAKYFELVKSNKKDELTLEARYRIERGFISNCLGEDNYYDGGVEDQVNIAGAISAAELLGGFIYPVKDPITKDNKTYRFHTLQQMNQLVIDGSNHKLINFQILDSLKNYIDTLSFETSTIDFVNSLTFDFTIP